jgi:hypothetical protein
VFVPQSGLSQFVLDQSSIKQNANGTWDVAYQVPQNTIGTHFSVTPGSSALVANGAVTSGKLVFKIPEGSLTSGAQVVLVLKDETTGQVRATDTITVPTGLGVQYTLDPNEITTNPDNSWRVVWHVPVNTIGSDFVMVNGTKGEFDGHFMGRLKELENIVIYTTKRYKDNPLVIQGPSLAAELAAGSVLADILKIGK